MDMCARAPHTRSTPATYRLIGVTNICKTPVQKKDKGFRRNGPSILKMYIIVI